MGRIARAPRLDQIDPAALGAEAAAAFLEHLESLGCLGSKAKTRAAQLATEVAELVRLAQLGGPIPRAWIAGLWPLLATPLGQGQAPVSDPDRLEPGLLSSLALVVLAIHAREALASGRPLEASELAALASCSGRLVRKELGARIDTARARVWLHYQKVAL